MKEEELLSWLIHQKRHSEIAEITDEILDKLIDSVEFLAVLFCKYVKIFLYFVFNLTIIFMIKKGLNPHFQSPNYVSSVSQVLPIKK